MLSEASPPPLPQEPRAALKRRARRLINTAFLALTAEGSIAMFALAAKRRGLAEFAAAPSWKERPVIRSFLDCAEIAVAVALAQGLAPRRIDRWGAPGTEDAIRRNVLGFALAAYQDRSLLRRGAANCALVSNSGIFVAALSVLPRYRLLSTDLAAEAWPRPGTSFSGWRRDGAWREGSVIGRSRCAMPV